MFEGKAVRKEHFADIPDAFTIKAVSQDDFEDVKVPDAPQQSPRAGAGTMSTGPVLK